MNIIGFLILGPWSPDQNGWGQIRQLNRSLRSQFDSTETQGLFVEKIGNLRMASLKANNKGIPLKRVVVKKVLTLDLNQFGMNSGEDSACTSLRMASFHIGSIVAISHNKMSEVRCYLLVHAEFQDFNNGHKTSPHSAHQSSPQIDSTDKSSYNDSRGALELKSTSFAFLWESYL